MLNKNNIIKKISVYIIVIYIYIYISFTSLNGMPIIVHRRLH